MKPVKTVIAVCFAALSMAVAGQQSSSAAPTELDNSEGTNQTSGDKVQGEDTIETSGDKVQPEDTIETSGDKVQPEDTIETSGDKV